MILYLIRHPEVDVQPGLCYGRSDLPLRAGWQRLLPQVSPFLPSSIAAYTSPLRRSSDFARALSDRCRIDPRLQEIDFGNWEMRPWDSLPKEQLEAWASDLVRSAPHGGESYGSLWQRVAEFARDLQREHSGDVALFGHAGPLRTLLMQYLNVPAERYPAFDWDFGAVSAVKVDNRGGARLIYHNCSAHRSLGSN